MWLMIRLSQEYEITLKIPVEVMDKPYDEYIKIVSDVSVKIKGSGYKLLSNGKFLNINTLNISYYNISTIKNGVNNSYYLESSLLKEQLNNILPENLNILKIEPERLRVFIYKKYYKKLKVIPHIIYSPYKQYDIYGKIYIEPKEVLVCGEKEKIENIEYIETDSVVLKNLTRSKYGELKLNFPHGVFESSTYKIKYYIPIEKYTEATLKIPIHLYNNEIKLFPSNVNVIFKVALKDYKKIKEDMFHVETTPLENNTTEKYLKLNLKKKAWFIKEVRLDPSEVEYLYIK